MKVPISIEILLHWVGTLLTEAGSDYPASDDSDAANRCAAEIAHLCHVHRVTEKLDMLGGGRESVDLDSS